MSALVSFLRHGTQCPQLQEAQLNNQLGKVTISYGKDERPRDEIMPGRLHLSHHDHDIIDVGNAVTITIDSYCISQAREVWESFNRQVLYTFGGAVAALIGLTVLKFCNLITTRLVFVPWVATAFFALLVFIRARELFDGKPSFPESFKGYSEQIIEFRKAIIVRNESLDAAKKILPEALQPRAAEFFTEHERALLNIPKEVKTVF
jgi:hypothetical protein